MQVKSSSIFFFGTHSWSIVEEKKLEIKKVAKYNRHTMYSVNKISFIMFFCGIRLLRRYKLLHINSVGML